MKMELEPKQLKTTESTRSTSVDPVVMQPGPYRGAYKIGRLRRYKALQQKGPITIFRAADRSRTMDARVASMASTSIAPTLTAQTPGRKTERRLPGCPGPRSLRVSSCVGRAGTAEVLKSDYVYG